MSSYLFSHLRKSLSDHFATFLATLFSMSIVLSCLSLLLLARQNLVTMAEKWGQDNEITAYVDENAASQNLSDIRAQIGKIKNVDKIDFVSKAEGAKRFLERMGHLSPDFLQSDNPAENPLPATFEVHVRANLSLGDRTQAIKEVAEKVSAVAGITEVSFGQAWTHGWNSFLRKFNMVTLFAIGFVLVLGLLIIGNATRVSMERRIEEIQVLELVGATSSWIRRPFLIEGAILGLLSAVISLGLSNFINGLAIRFFSSAGWLWTSNSKMNLSGSSAMIILIIGLLFGLFGALICVRRINTGWLAGGAESYD